MQLNKKILFKVKAQPWDQRPAAFLINISLCILYFSRIFHKRALWWHRIYYRRRNVQGICIHNSHSLTKSFQIQQHHPDKDDVIIRTDNLQLTLQYVHYNKYMVVNRDKQDCITGKVIWWEKWMAQKINNAFEKNCQSFL